VAEGAGLEANFSISYIEVPSSNLAPNAENSDTSSMKFLFLEENSEFLSANPEIPGSIPGATRFSK
jgi:hypothetical protein